MASKLKIFVVKGPEAKVLEADQGVGIALHLPPSLAIFLFALITKVSTTNYANLHKY